MNARRVVARVLAVKLLAALTVILPAEASESRTTDVFDAAPAEYSAPVAPRATGEGGGAIRVFSVEERTGEERRGEWVRVPLFFGANECPALDDLAIVPDASGDAPSIPWQTDDIRRGPDGGVSRVHLWFAIDLKPGEKRRFKLVRLSDKKAAPTPAPIALTTDGDEIRITTDEGQVTFGKDGGMRSLTAPSGEKFGFAAMGAFPSVAINYPASPTMPAVQVVLDRTTPGREVEWGSGPLFAKVRVRLAQPGGVVLEQEYRVPRHGHEIVITAALFPGERAGAWVKENSLLEGTAKFAGLAKAQVVNVPAGIRFALRAEHAYVVTALASVPSVSALLAVPLVLGGTNGQWRIAENGNVSLLAQRGLQRSDEGERQTLRAFWTEVRLVPAGTADPEELGKIYRAHVQPLVAVVEEPGVTLADLHAALRDVVREMKPIGWRQEAGRALVLADSVRAPKVFRGSIGSRDGDVESLLAGARNATAGLTNHGARTLREDEKGRAYGGLDPYHITYTQSAAAAVAVLSDAPASIAEVNLTMARAVREFGGRVDRAGSPYIDCFNRTLNMQLGPVLFGLTAGAAAGDTALVRFYRDLATAPAVAGVFGRGQRPYTGAPTTTPDQTDFLYQSICDFWLRTAELLGNEDLNLHPLAYGRYTDCIDVMADRYHGVGLRDKLDMPGGARANFFRGQAHTHRWLGWSCAPFIRLLEDPAEHGAVGLTEAVRYTQAQKGRWKNWPDLTFYILADLLLREALPRYVRPALPDAPQNLQVRRPTGAATDVSWNSVPGAAEYRVYRAEANGGPWHWLNSPYFEQPSPPLTATLFHDSTGTAKSIYTVMAVDAAGRQSRWSDRP